MKTPQIVTTTGAGRRALCIGIDSYTRAPLRGAVSDAERWAEVLERHGFAITILRNGEATRERVLQELTDLIGTSVPGDRVVVTFAGHGTCDTGRSDDTAIVCADAEEGGIILDDEIGDVMRTIEAGVNVTLFFDCCHSGTMTRATKNGHTVPALTTTVRHMRTDAHIREAFERLGRRKRQKLDEVRRLGVALGTALIMREVCIAACDEHEVAYEIAGAGVFTAAATALLEEGHAARWTNEQFVGVLETRMRRLLSRRKLRQKPRLTCAPWKLEETVLGADVRRRAA